MVKEEILLFLLLPGGMCVCTRERNGKRGRGKKPLPVGSLLPHFYILLGFGTSMHVYPRCFPSCWDWDLNCAVDQVGSSSLHHQTTRLAPVLDFLIKEKRRDKIRTYKADKNETSAMPSWSEGVPEQWLKPHGRPGFGTWPNINRPDTGRHVCRILVAWSPWPCWKKTKASLSLSSPSMCMFSLSLSLKTTNQTNKSKRREAKRGKV